jgi:hypothetical protein
MDPGLPGSSVWTPIVPRSAAAACRICIHDHPRFLALARRLGITLVFTPTEASWLNLIEPHFGVLKRATLSGSGDRDHVLRRRGVYRFLRLRHRKLGNASHPLTRIRLVTPIKFERHCQKAPPMSGRPKMGRPPISAAAHSVVHPPGQRLAEGDGLAGSVTGGEQLAPGLPDPWLVQGNRFPTRMLAATSTTKTGIAATMPTTAVRHGRGVSRSAATAAGRPSNPASTNQIARVLPAPPEMDPTNIR